MDKSSSGGAEASLGSLASKPKIEHHKSIRESPLQVHGIGQFYVSKLWEEMVYEECPKQKCLGKQVLTLFQLSTLNEMFWKNAWNGLLQNIPVQMSRPKRPTMLELTPRQEADPGIHC